jgi:hypothetical protein
MTQHSSSPAIPGNFVATLFPVHTSKPLNTGAFVPRNTPGNVAICLSGGGSRALSAGIGQLQALEALQINGASLLSQSRAISTVSGGGWLGIPFVYLQSTSDAAYLGPYVDPADLTLDGINTIPSTQIGARVNSDFTLVYLAVEALALYACGGVQPDMLWQTLIGLHILQPYGLFPQDVDHAPASLFSYNSAALTEFVTGPNPDLAAEPANLIADAPGQQRPYLVCNFAMFVTSGGQPLLAPVQSTPFTTGIMSVPPDAVDFNNRQVGGGGVASFAFNSAPADTSNATVHVQQNRQWSLVDAAGTSSAAFAAAFKDIADDWSRSPHHFRAAVRVHKEHVKTNLMKIGSDPDRIEAYLQSLLDAADRADLATIRNETGVLQALIPAYRYWPVDHVPSGETVAPTQFADGGLLENLGVASMLAYEDIDKLIAFVNSSTTLSKDDTGVIIVDDNIPPLFGYQPYNGCAGYQRYAGATAPYYPYFQKNQVFDYECFQPLLNRLWEASGSGSNRTAPIVSQSLTTVRNDWFGVAAGKQVTVLWVHLQIASHWYDSFGDLLVRAAMDWEILTSNFPHYDTLHTELSPAQVSLLSNLAAWTVAASENADHFISLFTTAANAAQAGT